jgi:hypothetical protein
LGIQPFHPGIRTASSSASAQRSRFASLGLQCGFSWSWFLSFLEALLNGVNALLKVMLGKNP